MRPEVTGGRLTEFLQGYILSGRPLGRMGEGDATVFAPYLLPQLLALKGEEDGSAIFQGREGRTFLFRAPAPSEEGETAPEKGPEA